MSVHHHSKVNALVNPLMGGDHVIAESGEKYIVMESMSGYWLHHILSGHDLTRPCGHNQIAICAAAADLANV